MKSAVIMAAFLAAGVNGAGSGGGGGGAQYPNLLSGYAYRPAWSVAGVDFAVGVPSGTVLKDPSTISMAGVSINTTSHVVTVSGNNVTLDSYDFTMNGGWAINLTGSGTTISNSSILAQSNGNYTPIYANGGAGGFTVTHCSIDGGGGAVTIGQLILMEGTGTVTITYSWLHDAGGDGVDLNTGSNASTLIFNYNLIGNIGMTSGAHGDLIQFLASGATSLTALYNTTYESSSGSTQGFSEEPDVGASLGNIIGGEVGHNTFTGYIAVFTSVTIADLTGTYTVDNNYFDPTNTLGGLAYGGSRGGYNDGNAYSVFTNNINMVTGAVYQDTPPGTP